MSFKKRFYKSIRCFLGKITRIYYWEDYVRVHPGDLVYNHFGKCKKASQNDINNFLNHRKFYYFAAQFVKGKCIADVGCGSGYGCEIIKKAGATLVCGSDISKHAIDFARSNFSSLVEFTIQNAIDMSEYADDFFDISISSEVLEHLKEYGMEEKALDEMSRVTKDKGLLVIGTPNSEMLGSHGFYFDEINVLLQKKFSQFCIFENALVPFGDSKELWRTRLIRNDTGIIVSQNINLSETVLPKDKEPEIKRGIKPGCFKFADYEFDTSLLHNTHSWIILAINNK